MGGGEGGGVAGTQPMSTAVHMEPKDVTPYLTYDMHASHLRSKFKGYFYILVHEK